MVKGKVKRVVVYKVDEKEPVVLCNDRPLFTPRGAPYRLPSRALAEAVRAEWVEIGEDKPSTARLPLTSLAATAIDLVPDKREQTVQSIVVFASTDLLCHRASLPFALVERQQAVWQPLLDWCALDCGALLKVGTGVVPIQQDAAAIAALEKCVAAYDAFQLVGLQSVVETTGSLVLGLALARGARDADEIFNAAELDALFQRESWGNDPVTESRLDSVRKDIADAAKWFRLMKA